MEKETKLYKYIFNRFVLLDVLLKDKFHLFIFIAVFGILGIFCSFQIPRIYKASLMLAPEESGSMNTSNISSLASMVGMDLKFGNSEDAIYPEIYPDVVSSTNFVTSLFDVKVTTKDGTLKTTYYNYLTKHQKAAFWDKAKGLLVKVFAPNESAASDPKGKKVNPFLLTKKQYEVVNGINGCITCSVDKKTSVISIEVTDQDPLIAATMCDTVKVRLQKFIVEYRTQKARNNVSYAEKLYREAKINYEKSRQAYAAYADANQDMILAEYSSKLEDLENEMQLQFNIFTQCLQQLQISKAKLQEKTPVFTEVKEASVPVKHSNMPKLLILIAFMVFGLITRLVWLIIRNYKTIFIKVVVDD